jgi:hypothetical protein
LFSPERVSGSYGACERTSEAPLALMMVKRGTQMEMKRREEQEQEEGPAPKQTAQAKNL